MDTVLRISSSAPVPDLDLWTAGPRLFASLQGSNSSGHTLRLFIKRMARSKPDMQSAKAVLRKATAQVISQIPKGRVAQQSQLVTSKVLELPAYQDARRISVYLSTTQEVHTEAIVYHALDHGKAVFVPYIRKTKTHSNIDMLRLNDRQDFESLKPDSWGIPSLTKASVDERERWDGSRGSEFCGRETPHQEASSGDKVLDLVLVPGVAFTPKGGRLGHGKGYYDSFFADYQSSISTRGLSSMPELVGLALEEQILPPDQVPTMEHDWFLDKVIVGDGTVHHCS